MGSVTARARARSGGLQVAAPHGPALRNTLGLVPTARLPSRWPARSAGSLGAAGRCRRPGSPRRSGRRPTPDGSSRPADRAARWSRRRRAHATAPERRRSTAAPPVGPEPHHGHRHARPAAGPRAPDRRAGPRPPPCRAPGSGPDGFDQTQVGEHLAPAGGPGQPAALGRVGVGERSVGWVPHPGHRQVVAGDSACPASQSRLRRDGRRFPGAGRSCREAAEPGQQHQQQRQHASQGPPPAAAEPAGPTRQPRRGPSPGRPLPRQLPHRSVAGRRRPCSDTLCTHPVLRRRARR